MTRNGSEINVIEKKNNSARKCIVDDFLEFAPWWRKFIDEFILREEGGGTKEDCKRSEFFDTVGWCGIFYTRDRMKSEKEGCGWQKPQWLRLSLEKLWLLSRLFICRWSFCSLRRLPQSRAAEIAPPIPFPYYFAFPSPG